MDVHDWPLSQYIWYQKVCGSKSLSDCTNSIVPDAVMFLVSPTTISELSRAPPSYKRNNNNNKIIIYENNKIYYNKKDNNNKLIKLDRSVLFA